MRGEIAAADRRFEVRRAITAWRKAGLVDLTAEPALAAAYADDRVRTSPIFRALFFVFTWFGFSTAFSFGMSFVLAALGWEKHGVISAMSLLAGAALLAAAEILTGPRRLRRFGIEEACAWIGCGFVLGGGLWWLAEQSGAAIDLLVIVGAWATAALATLVAWRWATPGMGAVAALALFLALSQLPANQLLWLLVAGVASAPLALLSTAAHISPEHRGRLGEAFIVVVVMFYVAVHVVVVEERLFPEIRLGDGGRPANLGHGVSPAIVALSLAAMVAVPLLLLLAGLRRRFRPAIDLGLLLAGATGVTFAVRWSLAPLWLRLILEGAGLGVLALYVRRALARREGGEWRGLTGLPLAEDRESFRTLEVAATLAVFSPAARAVEAKGFEGGGGELGGGGASAKF